MVQKSVEVLESALPGVKLSSWLDGIRIVGMGDSVSLNMATSILSQFGAILSQVVDIEHVPSDADIILVDAVNDGGDLLGSVDDYLRRVDTLNQAVWVTTSAYGLTDPRATAKASETTLLAAGGILGHTPGPGGLPPTIPAGDVALKLIGNVIAMAALHGLHDFRSHKTPVHIDLSGQAAIIATGLALEMSHALNECPSSGGTARYGAPTGFFPCVDGSVYVLLLEQHQWKGFQKVLSPALDHIETIDEAAECDVEVNAALSSWTMQRSVAECESTLQGAGVPATTVHTVETFLESVENAGRPPSVKAALPAAVQGLTETEQKRDHIPLRELKVLDAGHVLAVPLSAAWLGAMGAQVTKAEDPNRLDIYRRRGPFAQGISGLNRSAYFNHLNFNKHSIDVQVDADGSSLEIDPYDVVMHNLSPHRAALLGVDPAGVALSTTSPKMSLASSGFGRTGAWKEYRAYGTTIHAFGGLISATQNARGEMSGIGTPWADPLCSVATTIWVLAWSLAPNKSQNISVDVSMAESLVAHLMDQLGVEAASNYLPGEFGGDFFIRIPGSDAEIAVTIQSAEEAKSYERELGVSVPNVTRRGERFDLPSQAGKDMNAKNLETRLQSAGVRASIVYDADDLAQDARLFQTGVFKFVESSALGSYPVVGLPWSISGVSAVQLTAAPERA